jgi:MFS family permease
MAHITILGFGVGGLTATVPMWVSECTQARNRGIMVMLSGWFAVGGLVLATWLEFGLYFVPNNSVSWRLPIAFQAVFALIIVSTVLFMPESPRWLIKMDRVEEARGILATLDDIPQESQEMAENLAMIQYTLTEEMRLHDSASPFALTHNRHLHRTLLAMGVNFFAQMSGISVITSIRPPSLNPISDTVGQLPGSYQARYRSGNSVVQVLLYCSSIGLGEDHS